MSGRYRCPACKMYLTGVELDENSRCPKCAGEVVDLGVDGPKRMARRKKRLDKLITGAPVVSEPEDVYLKRKLTEDQEKKHVGNAAHNKRRRRGRVGRGRALARGKGHR